MIIMVSGQKPPTPLLEMVGRPVRLLVVIQWRSSGGGGYDRGMRGPISEGALAIMHAPRQPSCRSVGERTSPDRLLYLPRRHGTEVVPAPVPGRHGGP